MEASMNTKRCYCGVLVLLTVAGVGVLAAAQGQKSDTRAEFMRQKLQHCNDLLEGLTREDFPRIAKSAKALRALSEAAVWAEPKFKSQPMYGWLSVEFQELTDEIATRANEKNLDGATLGYLQLTANCVRCHRNLRDGKK
jgi:hypothetical protein